VETESKDDTTEKASDAAPAATEAAEPSAGISNPEASSEAERYKDRNDVKSLEETGLSLKPLDVEESSPTTSNAAGIALPSMPTRARGPARKGRSGATASSGAPTTSPSIESSKTPSGPLSTSTVVQSGDEASREQHSIASPVRDNLEYDRAVEDIGIAEEKHAHIVTGDEPAPRSPIKRSSTVLSAGSGRLSPPVPPASFDQSARDSSEVESSTSMPPGSGEPLEATSVRQGTSDDSNPAAVRAESLAGAPSPGFNAPVAKDSAPIPPRIDTQASSELTSLPSTTSDTSPVSPQSNRRSMTRPPIPSGFTHVQGQNDEAVTSVSPRASLDSRRSLYGNFGDSHDSEMFTSSPQQERRTLEPDNMSDSDFANPELDAKDKEPVPPPVSKPFDTELVTGGNPTARIDSNAGHLHTYDSVPPIASSQVDSVPSRASTSNSSTERMSEQETNISAMKSYQAAPASEAEKVVGEDDTEEEYEDPEVARRQALAKRMAAMGGMKIGMLPQMPSMVKRKKTLPKETDTEPAQEQSLSPPPTSPPPRPPPMAPFGKESGDSKVEPPSSPVRSPSSYRPPAGAFVLPMPGRPAVPPPPAPQSEDRDRDTSESHDASAMLDARLATLKLKEPEAEEMENNGEDQDDDEVEELAGESSPIEEAPPLAPRMAPPPIPAGRPPLPPPPLPTGQSFIDDDTDTDGGASEKRTSFVSSTGVGSLSDFPAPPAPGVHQRTQSSASRLSAYEQPDTLHEEPDMIDDDQEDLKGLSEQTEPGPPPPPRPARPPPPAIDTTEAAGRAPLRRESMAEPESPARSVHSVSQHSLPGTPASASNPAQERFGALSPTSSRRSSALVSGSGAGAGPSPVQPGLNNEYLAYLATNSARTKSREFDGPLAHTLNDIAFTYRSDPASFGQTVWRTSVVKGQAPDLEIHGRIDAGCVFLAWDAKFDRGLGRSSLKVGSLEVPHVGIIAEGAKDMKKAKIKVVELVQGRHNVETYKLDDLKSGTAEIRRLA
jgi:hypothetical protein